MLNDTTDRYFKSIMRKIINEPSKSSRDTVALAQKKIEDAAPVRTVTGEVENAQNAPTVSQSGGRRFTSLDVEVHQTSESVTAP